MSPVCRTVAPEEVVLAVAAGEEVVAPSSIEFIVPGAAIFAASICSATIPCKRQRCFA